MTLIAALQGFFHVLDAAGPGINLTVGLRLLEPEVNGISISVSISTIVGTLDLAIDIR